MLELEGGGSVSHVRSCHTEDYPLVTKFMD